MTAPATQWIKLDDETARTPESASAFLARSIWRNATFAAQALPRAGSHAYGGYWGGVDVSTPPSWSCHPQCPTGHFYAFNVGTGATRVKIAVSYTTVNPSIGGVIRVVHLATGARFDATVAGTATLTAQEIELTDFGSMLNGTQWFWIGWIPDIDETPTATEFMLGGVNSTVWYTGVYAVGRMNHLLTFTPGTGTSTDPISLFVGFSRSAPTIATQLGIDQATAFEVFPNLPTDPSALSPDTLEWETVKTTGYLYELGMITVHDVGFYAISETTATSWSSPYAHGGVSAGSMQALQLKQQSNATSAPQTLAIAPPPAAGSHPTVFGADVSVEAWYHFNAVDNYAQILAELMVYSTGAEYWGPIDATLSVYTVDGVFVWSEGFTISTGRLSFTSQTTIAPTAATDSVGFGNMQRPAEDWGMGWSSAVTDAVQVTRMALVLPSANNVTKGDQFVARVTVPVGGTTTWLFGLGVSYLPSPVPLR